MRSLSLSLTHTHTTFRWTDLMAQRTSLFLEAEKAAAPKHRFTLSISSTPEQDKSQLKSQLVGGKEEEEEGVSGGVIMQSVSRQWDS